MGRVISVLQYAKQALSAANSTVKKGVYDATLLETVDADLVVGNIIVGATIFGKVGAASPGTATHDIEDNTTGVTGAGANPTSITYRMEGVAAGADYDLASMTQTYAAGSLAEAYGFALIWEGTASTWKLRLYMDGVQAAESGYLTSAGAFELMFVMGNAALSGSKIVKVSAHNYSGGALNLLIAGARNVNPRQDVSGVFAGSVKVV